MACRSVAVLPSHEWQRRVPNAAEHHTQRTCEAASEEVDRCQDPRYPTDGTASPSSLVPHAHGILWHGIPHETGPDCAPCPPRHGPCRTALIPALPDRPARQGIPCDTVWWHPLTTRRPAGRVSRPSHGTVTGHSTRMVPVVPTRHGTHVGQESELVDVCACGVWRAVCVCACK